VTSGEFEKPWAEFLDRLQRDPADLSVFRGLLGIIAT
jgi:hypothetical protein